MADKLVFKLNHCRICKNKNLKKVIDLGTSPPANEFLKKSALNKEERFFPLAVNFCSKCGLLQLTHVVSPKLLFGNYVYVSSTSPVFIKHFEDYASDVVKRLDLKKGELVVDLGSNDGILLKPFKKLGMKILGIDPAKAIAKKATKEGLETLLYFFDQNVAKKILKKYGEVSVMTANNVFAHINDIDEIIKGFKLMTHANGVFVMEAPYLIDFIQKNLFDLIYHEHLSYYSIRPLMEFFKRHNMQLFDVQYVPVHGGSIRIYAKKSQGKYKVAKIVNDLVKKELKLKLDKADTFIKFSDKIEANKQKLIKILKDLKTKNKKIVAYGAPAKGNTLLNYFKIGPKTLDFVVDDSSYKQGLYTPGTHLIVVSSSMLKENKPDYIFILAWNFAEPIMNKLSDFKKNGGHFIIPVPLPKII